MVILVDWLIRGLVDENIVDELTGDLVD